MTRAELARRRRVDTQRRRLQRKKLKKTSLGKGHGRFLKKHVRYYMRWNPSDAVERFLITAFREYNAKTWDEAENLVLEGWITDIPNVVRNLIFNGGSPSENQARQ